MLKPFQIFKGENFDCCANEATLLQVLKFFLIFEISTTKSALKFLHRRFTTKEENAEISKRPFAQKEDIPSPHYLIQIKRSNSPLFERFYLLYENKQKNTKRQQYVRSIRNDEALLKLAQGIFFSLRNATFFFKKTILNHS